MEQVEMLTTKEINELALADAKKLEASAIKEARIMALNINKARKEGKKQEAEDLMADLAEIVEYANKLKAHQVYSELSKAKDPMLEAVKLVSYECTAIKEEKKDGAAIGKIKVDEKMKEIDLLRLDRMCGGIGKNDEWVEHAEKFNFIMTKCVAKELGSKQDFSDYAMSKIAREFNLGEKADITSNTTLLKALRTIIKDMIGDEYKVISYDVNYVKAAFSKKGKSKLSISVATHKHMRSILLNACHRIVTNAKAYNVEYKSK